MKSNISDNFQIQLYAEQANARYALLPATALYTSLPVKTNFPRSSDVSGHKKVTRSQNNLNN